MIYAVLVSFIFVGIGIKRNKTYEYHKVIAFALMVYSILFRFMLLDGQNRQQQDGTLLFSGGFFISPDHMGLLTNLTYFGMLIGLIIFIHSYARQ